MTIQVRDATPADGAAMGAVQIAAWRAAYAGVMRDDYLAGLDPDAFGDRWRRSAAEDPKPGRALLVGGLGERVVAIAATGEFRARASDDEPTGELWMLNTHPDAFGTGAAVALHAEALRRLAGAGHREVVLWVVRENARARRFYEREGWTADGHETIADLGGVDVTEIRYSRQV
jgi:ribosomal protein S18 acetylase RimI-like enzyme